MWLQCTADSKLGINSSRLSLLSLSCSLLILEQLPARFQETLCCGGMADPCACVLLNVCAKLV